MLTRVNGRRSIIALVIGGCYVIKIMCICIYVTLNICGSSVKHWSNLLLNPSHRVTQKKITKVSGFYNHIQQCVFTGTTRINTATYCQPHAATATIVCCDLNIRDYDDNIFHHAFECQQYWESW